MIKEYELYHNHVNKSVLTGYTTILNNTHLNSEKIVHMTFDAAIWLSIYVWHFTNFINWWKRWFKGNLKIYHIVEFMSRKFGTYHYDVDCDGVFTSGSFMGFYFAASKNSMHTSFSCGRFYHNFYNLD